MSGREDTRLVAHADSFEDLGSGYARDRLRVWANGYRIEGVDRDSFVLDSDGVHGRDRDWIYDGGYRWKTTDPKFRFLPPDAEREAGTYTAVGYGVDSEAVYFFNFDRLGLTHVPGADPETFEPLFLNGWARDWGADQNDAYCGTLPLGSPHPEAFVFLDVATYRDVPNVPEVERKFIWESYTTRLYSEDIVRLFGDRYADTPEPATGHQLSEGVGYDGEFYYDMGLQTAQQPRYIGELVWKRHQKLQQADRLGVEVDQLPADAPNVVN